MVERRQGPMTFSLRLVRALLPPEERGSALGELDELYQARVSAEGPARADRWLRRETRRFALRLLLARLRAAAVGSLVARLPFGERARDLGHELLLGARRLRRAPIFALSTAAVVALGLGGATTVFAIVHGVLLRPLPYPSAERLMMIRNARGDGDFSFSMADYLALADQQGAFERVAAFDPNGITLTTREGSQRRRAYMVTSGFLPLLGIEPALGRGISEADTRPGAEPVALIATGLWETHFGGDPRMLGRTLTLDHRPVTVVGILPPARGPLMRGQDVVMPLVLEPPPRKGPFFLNVVGLLSTRVSRPAAEAELERINERIFPIWEDSFPDSAVRWTMQDLEEAVLDDVGPALWVALAAVGALLLIALTNATNMLVARALGREREAAVRRALGAGRARLASHALAESVMLTGAGTGAGLLLAVGGLRAAAAVGGPFIPRIDEVDLGAPVLGFVAATAALCVACLAVGPATQTRASLAALRGGGRTSSTGRGPRRLRELLVIGQLSVTVPLLVGGALLVSSLASLRSADPGFDPDGLLTLQVTLPPIGYESESSRRQFWLDVLDAVRTVPGVEAAGVGNGRPPDDPGFGNNFVLEDRPLAPGASQPSVPWTIAGPGFFEALGIELLAGRMFDATNDSARVALVDASWAARYFGEPEDAVGRRFVQGGCTVVGRCAWWTVVGVVSDLEYNGIAQDDDGAMYLDASMYPQRGAFIFVRSAGDDPAALAPAVAQIIRRAEPTAPIADVATGTELLDVSLRADSFLTGLITVFGSVALLLSLVGVYGVLSYFVEQHRRDIGIRLALGGRPRQVAALVLRSAMRLVALGVVTGSCAALALSGLLERVLFQVDPRDPTSFAAAVACLIGAGLLACLGPALEASRLDPAGTLSES